MISLQLRTRQADEGSPAEQPRRDRRQLQNTGEMPGGVDRRSGDRSEDHRQAEEVDHRRSSDRRETPQPDLIPLPGFDRRTESRRDTPVTDIVQTGGVFPQHQAPPVQEVDPGYASTAFSTPPERRGERGDKNIVANPQIVMPQPIAVRQNQPLLADPVRDRFQTQPEPLQPVFEEDKQQEDIPLTDAQAAFMNSLNLSEDEAGLKGKGGKAGQRSDFGPGQAAQGEPLKLRRFTIAGRGTGKDGPSELKDEKVEWK